MERGTERQATVRELEPRAATGRTLLITAAVAMFGVWLARYSGYLIDDAGELATHEQLVGPVPAHDLGVVERLALTVTGIGCAGPPPTPVGPWYSPKTDRSASAHSPVVAPTRAQAIDASMRLPSFSAAYIRIASIVRSSIPSCRSWRTAPLP